MLTPIGPVRLHSIRCAYCGQSLDFIPESGREEAVQIVSAHEAICEKNPLVQKLQSAQEEISLLEAIRNQANRLLQAQEDVDKAYDLPKSDFKAVAAVKAEKNLSLAADVLRAGLLAHSRYIQSLSKETP